MSNIALITTIFNHLNNPYFVSNWKQFTEYLSSLGVLSDLFVCEILPENSKSDLNCKNHWVVFNNSPIWHKESGLNYLLKRIPDNYEYIIAIDNDVIFSNNDWLKHTLSLLESHVAVQPFENIEYLLKNQKHIEFYAKGMCKVCDGSKTVDTGNPGMCMAYHRSYLKHTQGFFDKCFVGGGDVINILPFYYDTHKVPLNVFETVSKEYRSHAFNYLELAVDFIRKSNLSPISFVPDNTVSHLFHGYWNNRNYSERYHLLLNKVFDKNSDDFYVLNKDSEEEFKQFFNKRSSMQEDEPIIIGSSKYYPDRSDLLWVKPISELYFYNIDRVAITFNRNSSLGELGEISIKVNEQNVNLTKLYNQGSQKISILNPEKFSIKCSKSVDAPGDVRELGMYISEIQIKPKQSEQSFPYALDKVI